MSFYLVVKTGSQAGLKLPLKEGFSIGRSRKSSLCLSDPSVSACHAKVVKSDNRWLLVDNHSFNGTKFRGKKVEKLFLSQKICFQVGRNTIEVLEEKHSKASVHSSVVDFLDSKTVSSFRLRAENLRSGEQVWQQKVLNFIKENQLSFRNEVRKVEVLEPSLRIRFVKGLQVGTEWKVTYGPRKVGKNSLDLPIYDEQVPGCCFEIFPSLKGTIVKAGVSKGVLLNGKDFSSHRVEEGDRIDFGETSIKIFLF